MTRASPNCDALKCDLIEYGPRTTGERPNSFSIQSVSIVVDQFNDTVIESERENQFPTLFHRILTKRIYKFKDPASALGHLESDRFVSAHLQRVAQMA